MSQFFGQATRTTGYATKESGEDITWADVDYDKLRSSRMSKPNITSWDMKSGARDDNDNIGVNDSKGGAGGLFFPSTEEVRQALRPVDVPQTSHYIDPYTGFSEAFMSNQLTPLPSSQRSVSPISQARDSLKEDTATEYMGRPLSDDDDDSPRVGQIL